MILVMINPL